MLILVQDDYDPAGKHPENKTDTLE